VIDVKDLMTGSRFEEVLPLSPLQEGLLFHSVFDDSDAYLVQLAFDIDGTTDDSSLRDAVVALVERHASLRASFHYDGLKRPLQVIHKSIPIPWRTEDWSTLTTAEQESDFERLRESDRFQQFDLARPPLLRFVELVLGQGRRRLLFTYHHILFDGSSILILARDLLALYTGSPVLAPVPPVRAFHEWLAGCDAAAAHLAWRDELRNAPDTLPVFAASGTDADPCAALSRELSPEATAALTAQASAQSLTVNSVLATLWGLLLGQLCDRTDVIFGTVVATRPDSIPGMDEMVGLFLNTVPVRVCWCPDDSLRALSARVQADFARMYEFRHFGLSRIQKASGRRSLFDTFFTYGIHLPSRNPAADGLQFGLSKIQVWDAAHYPLGMLVRLGERLSVTVEYQPQCLKMAAAQDIMERYLELITSFIGDPHLCL
jgi:hypothetical protein